MFQHKSRFAAMTFIASMATLFYAFIWLTTKVESAKQMMGAYTLIMAGIAVVCFIGYLFTTDEDY